MMLSGIELNGIEKGKKEGFALGIKEGKAEAKLENLKNLFNYLKENNKDKSEEELLNLAKSILKM